MTLHQQHETVIDKNYFPDEERIDLAAAARACSEISKEYAKGFGEWIAENGYGFSHVTKAWHIPEAKTTDQLLSLYDDHLSKVGVSGEPKMPTDSEIEDKIHTEAKNFCDAHKSDLALTNDENMRSILRRIMRKSFMSGFDVGQDWMRSRITAKTTTYLLLLALLMAGCGESRQIEPEKKPELVEGIVSIPLRRGSAIIREIKIDSCEYLYDFNSTLNVPTTLSHKGNCKNPIHKSNP